MPFTGTQIGPDGRRYTIGDVPAAPAAATGRIPVVWGDSDDGDVVWRNPETDRLEYADIDTVNAFVPTSS